MINDTVHCTKNIGLIVETIEISFREYSDGKQKIVLYIDDKKAEIYPKEPLFEALRTALLIEGKPVK